MREVMWKFKAGRFSIVATIEPDSDLDLSWDETGETRDKLASGEWQAFGTWVRVYLNGAEIGSDSLFGSIYADPIEFFREHIGINELSRRDGCNYGAYFPDMIRAAISEARGWMAGAGISKAA